ncbi:MAG: hypothetical protein C5B59_06540 [Bacteroidetes bacterium]|nr:MAG: hypothetical protein C5B59_06540 [Bacteroidota bacterium]
MRPQVLKRLLPLIVKIISKHDFDSIAFRGISGAVLAMPVAMRMKKNLICVRKPEDYDKNHDTVRVMGDEDCKRYVIIDDFVASGRTAEAIVDGVYTHLSETAECIGVLETLPLWDKDTNKVIHSMSIDHLLRTVKKPQKIEED